ncbi:MAG: hypothetical protein ACI9F9_003076 [Candidatus Paceibacteria bacterium]|jgi:hypothetical protein
MTIRTRYINGMPSAPSHLLTEQFEDGQLRRLVRVTRGVKIGTAAPANERLRSQCFCSSSVA